MKIVFISSDVSQSDILANSFLDGIDYKITNQVSLQDIPENATHVTFIYHERDIFPFVLKERYALYTQIHDLSFAMIPEEVDDLSYVKVYDDNNKLIEAYYVSKQYNHQNKFYKRYPYTPDDPFISDDYIKKSGLYSELDDYHCDISSYYFNDMMYLFHELQKRNKHIVIDFLTCNFKASTIQEIENHFSNIVMRVSTNDTGNPEYGGDWIMEYTSDETETAYVKDIYFNENITNFSVILVNYYVIQVYNYFYNLSDVDWEEKPDDGLVLKVSKVTFTNYIIFRYYRYIITHVAFDKRSNDLYLDVIYNKNQNPSYTQRANPTLVIVPKQIQYIDYRSGFSHYSGLSSWTDGIQEVKFETRDTNNMCYLGTSVFRDHRSITTVTIDISDVAFHEQERTDNNVMFYGGHTFRSMPNLTDLTLTGTDLSFIPPSAAYGCTNLETVTLGSNIKTIMDGGFRGCTSLTTINLENIITIKRIAFLTCNILTILDLSNIESIGQAAFCQGLTADSEVYLGTNLSDINDAAFGGNNTIKTIVLPIGFNWFDSSKMNDNTFGVFGTSTYSYSSTVTNLYYDKQFGTIDSTSFKGGTIVNAYGYEVLDEGSVLIEDYTGTITEINGRIIVSSLDEVNYILKSDGIKEQINIYQDISSTTFTDIQSDDTLILNVAVNILNDAFKTKLLSSVVFGVSLETIGIRAFQDCSNITNLDFNKCIDLSNIEEKAFKDCRKITSLDLSNCTSLTTIGNHAFYKCNEITSVILPESLTSLNNNGFQMDQDNKLTNIDFTNCTNLQTIGNYAFQNCRKITSLDLSNCTSLTTIGNNAFNLCTTLSTIIFPSSLKNIEYNAFYNCNQLTSIDLEDTKITILNNIFNHQIISLTNIILPITLIKINSNAIKMKNENTIIEELFLSPDISFNDTNGDSYIQNNSFYYINFTNLYYNKANGTFSSSSISSTNAIGYTINGSNIIIEPNTYQSINGTGKTIWGYNIIESTDITLSSSKSSYTIDLSKLSGDTTFTFSREDTSAYLLKFSITSTTSTYISYTNEITSETKTLASSNIKSKYFNSDLAMTLSSGRTDTITIEYITKSNFNINIGGIYDNLEAYDISSTQIKVSNSISDVTFIDSTISEINFQYKDITGFRFSGSFTIPNITNADETTLNSLYHKYSIVDNKLYDKLYFTFEDVTINRDFTDNYGSDHSFNITSKRYYINGLETPQLQLKSGETYDCSFPDTSFGIFGDISNTTDISGFNANVFGGTGSISSSDFTINSTSFDVSLNASGNYYYGHLTTHGVGGINTNISIVETVSGNWIQNKNSEYSTILTCYKVKEYSDILQHRYNHDNTGRIMKIPDPGNDIGNEKGYINGYYNPKINIKSGSDIIMEITNIVYDSSTNIAYEVFFQSPPFYIQNYNISNTFTNIISNNNKVLSETTISLQYIKLRGNNNNQYYIDNDNIQFINIDVSDTLTETVSFEQFDFDIITGYQLSSISRIKQQLIVNEMNIRCNNVDISLARLHTIQIGNAPKIRFIIEEQYTDDILLTFLFYYKKLEYYGYLRTISTPYFGGIEQSITLNPLQTSFPFDAYVGSFVITLNGKTHSKPIYIKVNEISKSDLDNLAYMISITGGLKTEEDIKSTLVSKFDVNTSTENNDKSCIIELFLQQQMRRNLSKLSTILETQTINILGKPRKISTFFNTDEPNNMIENLKNEYQSSGLSSSTYRPMTFGHSINGPIQILIQDPSNSDRSYLSHDKLFIINHTIRKFIDNTGSEISFNVFIENRMNDSTQNDVDISINYYNEYKYPRREFDVTISGGKFEINYTSGSKYNSDIFENSLIIYTGSALDENGNLNCHENEIYIFNQIHSSNLDSNGILNHALTVYPVNPSGSPMKYANVNCIPSLGGPLSQTRIFHCFKPKFFSEQMDTTKYYYGSICEALDISFGEWWMNELYDGSNINIIVDVNNYDTPSSFRFLKNHIRSIPSSKIKQFIDTGASSYIVNDISSIKLKYSGEILNVSNSSVYFHFDLTSESINMNNDTTLGIETLSHITTDEHQIYTSDISSIYIIEDNIEKNLAINNLTSIIINGSISNSDISVNDFDYTLLDIESKHKYVFKPSSFYLSSDLSRSFVVNEQILEESNVSISSTTSIEFKNDDTLIGTFGSNYNADSDWSFIDTSMGAYINILPTIPLGDDKGYTYGDNGDITISRNAWDVQSSTENELIINNQKLYNINNNTFTFNVY